ncbi:MAG TPA: cupin domain-containing protein [Thermoleophilaceae bacterium]|nr:cupin domain-containing protein [Thermoleophilaceae bacterium]
MTTRATTAAPPDRAATDAPGAPPGAGTPAAADAPGAHAGAGGHAPADALALTLEPVDPAAFLAEHWERRSLIVARDDPERFRPLLSPEDVEHLVCETRIRAPGFRMVKEGAQIPLAAYTEDIGWRPGSFSGMAVVERVTEEFARGATLVLQALHLHWPAAALYCRGLEASLGCPAQANAYLTPATSRGFAVHHDTHDVFVLQVSGRKSWRVYEPVLELPLKDQRWSTELGDPGPPVEEFTLEAGQTLYLPRGWPHEATTSDEESLHLTIGLHPTTRMDAMRMALDGCADDPEFRRSLPEDGHLPAELIDRLAARLQPGEVARRARRRFVASRHPILHDQLSQVRELDDLTATSPLERRPTVLFELEEAGDGNVTLVFEGKELRFPAKAAAAVRAIAGPCDHVRPADLPGPLDEAGRLVLTRRLVREGFLRQA